jgi:putative FmdB family regulatory protein
MPTYEYKCTSCGHQFERFTTKISSESTTDCPKCEEIAERLISGGAGLLFKGSGFYITDYRSDSYKKAEKKESGSGAADGGAKPDAAAKKPESKKKKDSD